MPPAASTASPRTATLDQRLDEALEESFPAGDPPSVTRAPKADGEPRDAAAREKERVSDELDEALEDSFPASDPPSLTRASKPEGDPAADTEDGAHEKRKASDRLDEALKESFPASDTPAQLQPGKA